MTSTDNEKELERQVLARTRAEINAEIQKLKNDPTATPLYAMLPATTEEMEKEYRFHERFRAKFLAGKEKLINEKLAAADRPRLVYKIDVEIGALDSMLDGLTDRANTIKNGKYNEDRDVKNTKNRYLLVMAVRSAIEADEGQARIEEQKRKIKEQERENAHLEASIAVVHLCAGENIGVDWKRLLEVALNLS